MHRCRGRFGQQHLQNIVWRIRAEKTAIIVLVITMIAVPLPCAQMSFCVSPKLHLEKKTKIAGLSVGLFFFEHKNTIKKTLQVLSAMSNDFAGVHCL